MPLRVAKSFVLSLDHKLNSKHYKLEIIRLTIR